MAGAGAEKLEGADHDAHGLDVLDVGPELEDEVLAFGAAGGIVDEPGAFFAVWPVSRMCSTEAGGEDMERSPGYVRVSRYPAASRSQAAPTPSCLSLYFSTRSVAVLGRSALSST